MDKQYKSSWVIATSVALILNFFFVYFMCVTVTKTPEKKSYTSYVGSIDLVKLRPRTYKPETKRPQERHIKQKIKTIKVKMDYEQDITKKIHPVLPFKLNFKLPESAGIAISKKLFISPPPRLKSIYSQGDLDSPLMPIIRLRPMYPMRARMLGIEGWVKVKFLVNKNGQTSDIQIIQAKPKGFFEKATIDAISRWRFKPPTVNGEPVKVIVETTIRYKLEQ